MGTRHLSYKDLTPAQRQKGAAEARQRVTAILSSNPFMPPEQRAHFMANLNQIDLWEQGRMPEPTPASPPRLPVAHTVGVQETVPAGDSLTK